jgi:hypothetical protein
MPMQRTKTCRVLGLLSVGSGFALLCVPGSAARLYMLPPQPPLVRALGVRDIGIGVALLTPRTAALGCSLRALADTLDLALIATEWRHRPRPFGASMLRWLGAVSLIAIAGHTRARLRAVDPQSDAGQVVRP